MSDKTPILKDQAYDIAKDSVMLYLPAAAVLYSALAAIWSLPFAPEVTGTVAAVVVFLGVVLKVSAKRYEENTDGYFVANDPNPMEETFRTEFTKNPFELANKGVVRLRVVDYLDTPEKESDAA